MLAARSLLPHAIARRGKNFLRNLAQRYAELEHRGLRATAPAVDFPMGANCFYFRRDRDVDEQRVFSTIKFLRKRREGFGIKRRAVGGTVNADVESFLLDDVGDGKVQQKDAGRT